LSKGFGDVLNVQTGGAGVMGGVHGGGELLLVMIGLLHDECVTSWLIVDNLQWP
jgi:hypothetical protein